MLKFKKKDGGIALESYFINNEGIACAPMTTNKVRLLIMGGANGITWVTPTFFTIFVIVLKKYSQNILGIFF